MNLDNAQLISNVALKTADSSPGEKSAKNLGNMLLVSSMTLKITNFSPGEMLSELSYKNIN